MSLFVHEPNLISGLEIEFRITPLGQSETSIKLKLMTYIFRMYLFTRFKVEHQ